MHNSVGPACGEDSCRDEDIAAGTCRLWVWGMLGNERTAHCPLGDGMPFVAASYTPSPRPTPLPSSLHYRCVIFLLHDSFFFSLFFSPAFHYGCRHVLAVEMANRSIYLSVFFRSRCFGFTPERRSSNGIILHLLLLLSGVQRRWWKTWQSSSKPIILL